MDEEGVRRLAGLEDRLAAIEAHQAVPLTYSERARHCWRCPACGNLYAGPGVCVNTANGPRYPGHPAVVLAGWPPG